MKIIVNENNDIQFEEVFLPIVVRTDVGDFGICQRDGGIEIMRNGKLEFACYTVGEPESVVFMPTALDAKQYRDSEGNFTSPLLLSKQVEPCDTQD